MDLIGGNNRFLKPMKNTVTLREAIQYARENGLRAKLGDLLDPGNGCCSLGALYCAANKTTPKEFLSDKGDDYYHWDKTIASTYELLNVALGTKMVTDIYMVNDLTDQAVFSNNEITWDDIERSFEQRAPQLLYVELTAYDYVKDEED